MHLGAQPRPRANAGSSTHAPSSVVDFKPTIISLEPYVAEIMHTVTAGVRKQGRDKRLRRYQPSSSRSAEWKILICYYVLPVQSALAEVEVGKPAIINFFYPFATS